MTPGHPLKGEKVGGEMGEGADGGRRGGGKGQGAGDAMAQALRVGDPDPPTFGRTP